MARKTIGKSEDLNKSRTTPSKPEESKSAKRRGRPPKPPAPFDHDSFGLRDDDKVKLVPIEHLNLDDTTFQYRFSLNPEPLVDSIRCHGVQMPVIVRHKPGDDGLQLVCGFRRSHAARAASLESVPAIIRELSDDEARMLAFAENNERRSINDLDRAHAIEKLRATGKTTAQVARLYRLSDRQVQNLEGLLAYPEELKQAIDAGEVKTTHALRLMQAQRKHGDKFDMAFWIAFVQAEQPSVEALKKAVREEIEGTRKRHQLMREKGQEVTINLNHLQGASDDEKKATVERLVQLLEALRR